MDRKVDTLRTRSSAVFGAVVALAVSLIAAASSSAAEPRPDWISLITGDQVAVDANGSLLAIRPATGRERIGLTVRRSGEHLYVVPADASALITSGALDPRLFDITLLARPEYRRQNEDGLAIIVAYQAHEPTAKTQVRSIDGVRLEHTYTSLNGDALTLSSQGSPTPWNQLTSATGIKKIWLDAVLVDVGFSD
ncbi:hypothetical protein [Kribbella catacumbae]|uniref:hypothetical protein n=1 Tax=Kribbella catacumbae TaxID=460086 RepID=UPI00037A70BB|nr:hypothetical protein [Kribbella catacumbae]